MPRDMPGRRDGRGVRQQHAVERVAASAAVWQEGGQEALLPAQDRRHAAGIQGRVARRRRQGGPALHVPSTQPRSSASGSAADSRSSLARRGACKMHAVFHDAQQANRFSVLMNNALYVMTCETGDQAQRWIQAFQQVPSWAACRARLMLAAEQRHDGAAQCRSGNSGDTADSDAEPAAAGKRVRVHGARGGARQGAAARGRDEAG